MTRDEDNGEEREMARQVVLPPAGSAGASLWPHFRALLTWPCLRLGHRISTSTTMATTTMTTTILTTTSSTSTLSSSSFLVLVVRYLCLDHSSKCHSSDVQAHSRCVLDVAEPVLSLTLRTLTSFDAVVLAREANQRFGHVVSPVTRRQTQDPCANHGYSPTH